MNFVPATSIAEVIERMDSIIGDCLIKSSRLGYFAILYKEVTIGVQIAIQQGFFEDGKRMELLDVVFANRYLKAYHDFANKLPATSSWQRTFEAAQSSTLTIVQHLLLGMNAHINLDLGIAAAEISTAQNIVHLNNDFQKINIVIINVYNNLLPRLERISWPIVMLGKIKPSLTNQIINFSIQKARDQAWNNALLLCNAGASNISQIINFTDGVIVKVANGIKNPGFIANAMLKTIRKFESNDIAKNLKQLNSV